MSNSNKFQLGLSTLEREIILDKLSIQGEIPTWLNGSLFRNGPSKFEVGNQQYRHLFDGLSMIHKFTFKEGQVSYRNRFLRSETYRKNLEAGRICVDEFATSVNRSIWQNVGSLLNLNISDNANLNITEIAGHFLAITGSHNLLKFDPYTLETLGEFDYTDKLPGLLTTGHPRRDFEKQEIINLTTDISQSSTYNIYRLPFGETTRQLITSIPVTEPAYIQSFALTENYIILPEFPLLTNPMKLITQKLKGKPFIENFTWKSEKPTRFLVVNRKEGKLSGIYEAEACFAFNQVNAFENQDEIIIDICAYPSYAIDDYYLSNLRNTQGCKLSKPELRRYKLALSSQSVSSELLSKEFLEFPRINSKQCQTKEYQFVYGIGFAQEQPNDFFNQLLKIDIIRQKISRWYEEGCYPGEPIFVPEPNSEQEDEGIILSVVLDGNQGNSFLLILDGHSFVEIARTKIPHHIPFGFHGQYFPSTVLPHVG
jgi:carotenoid cleavage dioxygenase-like enzyme